MGESLEESGDMVADEIDDTAEEGDVYEDDDEDDDEGK
jgi:hypothetical protein